MKNVFCSALAASLIILGSIPVFADNDELYIVDTSGEIGAVNLSTDTLSLLGNSGKALTDIAFTANGNLYGTSFTGLYSVNTTNAAATLIKSYGSVGNSGMDALVGSGSTLYAASYNTVNLYAIDSSTDAITTLKGATTGGAAGDLAFGPGGVLYDTLYNGSLDKLTLSGTTFTSKSVGSLGSGKVYGLATEGGTTYAVEGTSIYIVDLDTAALTFVYNYGGHGLGAVSGAAIGPLAVPEPRNIWLLLGGLTCVALYRRRARA